MRPLIGLIKKIEGTCFTTNEIEFFFFVTNKTSIRKPLEPSPYSVHYKSNLTHDQRELISHRQHVRKLHRNDLEDRYLELLDENFAMKKENTSNHDKIRKLVTKVLRLSSEDKRTRPSSSDATKSKLTTEENLKIK